MQYKCFRDCAKIYLNCKMNHQCKERCYAICGPCPIRVDRTRSCGHHYKQFVCSNNIEDVQCERPCTRKRICGHKCPSKCCEPCQNCQVKVSPCVILSANQVKVVVQFINFRIIFQVTKKSSCGHDVALKCCEEATPSKCSGKCPKLLPCGHPCTNKCKEPCTTACQTMVTLSRPGLCGHNLKVPCYLRMTGE